MIDQTIGQNNLQIYFCSIHIALNEQNKKIDWMIFNFLW